MNFKPREWQTDCMERFQARLDQGANTFVFEACMGAGKSAVAAMMAESLLRQSVDHVLVLVPWKSIQGDPEKGMLGAFGKLLGLDARAQFFSSVRRIAEQPIPQMDATITLYQEVCNDAAIETLKLWKSKGLRIGLICDEIHHANEINGTWGHYITQMKEISEFSIFMSGTFFRTDKNPIACVELDDNRNPIKHYEYNYQRTVRDSVVRTVTTRHINANVTLFDPKSNRQYNIELGECNSQELSAAKKQVLDPSGECVRYLIQTVHEGLTKTRTKYRDAACLFVCRPGNSDDYTQEGNEAIEDKHVHLIAKQIKELTGEDATVVTHHDKDAVGKISRFRKGTDPYLVAVNMVSEGCDIPRLRAVAFCRYTDSHMLFRQIVGRALRLHYDDRSGMMLEDGTAAQVYIPTFPRLVDFAKQLWDEAQEGVLDRRCKKCSSDPCNCVCSACGEKTCQCPCARCGQDPCECDEGDYLSPRPMGIYAEPILDGGHMGRDAVEEAYVQLASKVAAAVVQHMHANPVQFGHFLQACDRLRESGSPLVAQENPGKERERMARRINRMVRRIAIDVYEKNFAKAFYTEIETPFKEKFKLILETWPVEKLPHVEDRLEKRTLELSRRR